MKLRNEVIRVLLFMCLSVAAMVCPVFAQSGGLGAMGFLTTHTTVKAGDAGSWIRPGWDWAGRQFGQVATPDTPVQITVETWRDANLNLKFVIPDATPTILNQNGSFGALSQGDQISIYIDPNNSGRTTPGLQFTQNDNFATDHRYQITINNNAPSNQCTIKHFRPKNVFGSMVWDSNPLSTSACTFTYSSSSYTVNATIPLTDLGLSANPSDFGLAIAFINDLGVDYNNQAQLTGTAFPLSLPMANNNTPLEPEIFGAVTVSGVWSQPENWGIGYTSTVPLNAQNVQLEHGPEVWLASAIRLSQCNVGSWDGVAPGQWDQTSLTGWYKYYPAAPTCEMGVWVKAKNLGNNSVEGRLLILWADAGLGQQAWRLVKLTGPTVFAGPVNMESITRQIWSNVPPNGSYLNGATHPCLRVYFLPKDLTLTDPTTHNVIDEARLAQIDQNSDIINQMERAYNLQPYPNNPQAAQMNFTNLASQGLSCPTANQCRYTSLSRPLYASLQNDWVAREQVALNDSNKPVLNNRVSDNVPNDVKEPIVRVHIMGFGTEQTPPQQRYVFVEPLGGLAWAGTEAEMMERNKTPITFGITNPPILFRDFSTPIPKDIPSPARKIVLSSVVKTDGTAKTSIQLPVTKEVMKPGETMTASAMVSVEPIISKPAPCSIFPTKTAGSSLFIGMVGIGGAAGIGFKPRRRKEKKEQDKEK